MNSQKKHFIDALAIAFCIGLALSSAASFAEGAGKCFWNTTNPTLNDGFVVMKTENASSWNIYRVWDREIALKVGRQYNITDASWNPLLNATILRLSAEPIKIASSEYARNSEIINNTCNLLEHRRIYGYDKPVDNSNCREECTWHGSYSCHRILLWNFCGNFPIQSCVEVCS